MDWKWKTWNLTRKKGSVTEGGKENTTGSQYPGPSATPHRTAAAEHSQNTQGEFTTLLKRDYIIVMFD